MSMDIPKDALTCSPGRLPKYETIRMKASPPSQISSSNNSSSIYHSHLRGSILSTKYACNLGSPSYAFNITHVIHETSEFIKQVSVFVYGTYCPDPHLKRLCSERKLFVYSVRRRWNGSCTNLLCVCKSCGNPRSHIACIRKFGWYMY